VKFHSRIWVERTNGLSSCLAGAEYSSLVHSKVDVIVAVTSPAILAARKATETIPIVIAFWGESGLIDSGIVADLAHPGGNVTGVYMPGAELDAKRVQLLLQVVPKVGNVGVLDPGQLFTHGGTECGPSHRHPASRHRGRKRSRRLRARLRIDGRCPPRRAFLCRLARGSSKRHPRLPSWRRSDASRQCMSGLLSPRREV
jgi:ABC transporter substrate binding protein